MATTDHGTNMQDMLGQFINEAVIKAVAEQTRQVADVARKEVNQIVGSAVTRVNEVTQEATFEMQLRIHKMVEQSLARLSMEGERIIEQSCKRLEDERSKVLDDLPVALQESLMQMNRENETIFQRRSEEWLRQMNEQQTVRLNDTLQAQLRTIRQSLLEDTAASARAICDRNLFDVRSEFENHVNRCLQGISERLSQPMKPSRAFMRQ